MKFLQKTCLVLTIGLAGPALADTFFIATPLKSVPAFDESNIQLSLASAVLPDAVAGTPYTFDLQSHLTVVDGYNRGPAVFQASGLPSWASMNSNGQITGQVDPSIGDYNLAASVKYATRQSEAEYALSTRYPFSCLELLTKNPNATSGWYTLDVDGAGPAVPMDYYCDMTSAGGGWTRVVVQTESNPVTSWTGAVNGGSYSSAQLQIPTHTHTGFGRDEFATTVDAIEYQYTTGNIPKTLVTGISGKQYHIHRSSSVYYSSHDPDDLTGTLYEWLNTLTLDGTGGLKPSWAFSPQNPSPAYRGYALNGFTYQTQESFAWTVWVR